LKLFFDMFKLTSRASKM